MTLWHCLQVRAVASSDVFRVRTSLAARPPDLICPPLICPRLLTVDMPPRLSAHEHHLTSSYQTISTSSIVNPTTPSFARHPIITLLSLCYICFSLFPQLFTVRNTTIILYQISVCGVIVLNQLFTVLFWFSRVPFENYWKASAGPREHGISAREAQENNSINPVIDVTFMHGWEW